MPRRYWLAKSEPAGLATVNVTVKGPAVANALVGASSVLLVPSPKSHSQETGYPVEESVNWIASPTSTAPDE